MRGRARPCDPPGMTTPKRWSVRRGSVALTRLQWSIAVMAAAASVTGLVLIGVGVEPAGRLLLPAGGLTMSWLALIGHLRRDDHR